LNALRTEIEQREKLARTLEPDSKQRMEWIREIGNFANEFIAGLDSGKTFRFDPPPPRSHFDPPASPRTLQDLLADYQRSVLVPGLNPASGGHLGYIPGGGILPSGLGDFLAAVTNEFAGVFFTSPGAVRMEHDLIRWMCGLVGYPEGSLGNMTSGGSVANLIAFVTARDARGVKAQDIPRSVIYLTQQVHHCVHKAIRIGGMAESIVRHIDMDAQYRLDADALRRQVQDDARTGLRPLLVVGTAGTTDTGAVDPLDAIAEIARQNQMWFHVDAAYGGFFLLSELNSPDGTKVRDRFRGIEHSDSVAIDPHKGLFLSYGLGAVLIKDVRSLHHSHFYRATYLQDASSAIEELNPADLSPELTKHYRGLRLWLPLQLFGLQPFVAALDEKILLCRYFYEQIQALGFEVGPYPELSVCIYRFVPTTGDANEFNLRLVEAVHRDGTVFISSTTINGTVWLRLAVLCFRTHLGQIDYLLELLGRQIAAHRSRK
jgi:glutamate/tyrosine decarboxylase-like PLP-dependent enzyme